MKHFTTMNGANRRHDQWQMSRAEFRYAKNSSTLGETMKKFKPDSWRQEFQGFVYLINNQTVNQFPNSNQVRNF